MWFMNYIANPLVRWLLKSPLHRLLSDATMLITVRGRKSGRAYCLPVQYVQTGDLIYVFPGAPEKKTWWRNLRGGAPVVLRLRGQDRRANAELLSGEADCTTIAEALHLYVQRFPPSAQIHQIRRMPDGQFNVADLHTAAAETILVRIKLG
jgi:deazaflavin-dependent oxidoreductase (nitroreductase family)